MKEYNPGKFLRELFPEQTATPMQTLKWLVLYLANVALVFLGAWALGWNPLEISHSLQKALTLVFLALALLLFSGEIALWNRIKKRKREE